MTERTQRRIVILLAVLAALMAAAVYGLCVRRPPAKTLAAHPPAYARLTDGASRLDLNAAGQEELECLPGIGPVLAEAILARRAELGAFRSEEDVLSVPGVGEATYEKIRPYITY